MKPSELINFIVDLEKRYPVAEWKIEGVHIWPLLRINLMNTLRNLNLDRSLIKHRMGVSKKIGQWRRNLNYINFIPDIFACTADYQQNDRPACLANAVFLTYSTSRFFSVEGKRYDAWFDPLITQLHNENFTTFSMEIAPGNEYRIPRFSRSMFIECYLKMIRIKSLVSSPPRFKKWGNYDSFLCQIKEKGINTKLFSSECISRKFLLVLLISRFFQKILIKVKPKIGFLVNYYSPVGMAFNLACKKMGIISCEVQHGIIEHHCAYSRWSKIPPGGYDLLPKMFWTWRQKEKDIIEQWHSLGMVLTGSNLLAHFFKNKSHEFFAAFQDQIQKIKEDNQDQIHVLLTLQPGFGIPAMIVNLIRRTSDCIFWWVRLHPGMFSEEKIILNQLRQCGTQNWNLENASRLPLYAILLNVDVHVTSFSSVVIEAEQFGVPSIVTAQFGEEYYRDYIKRETCYIAFSEESLENQIKFLTKQRKPIEIKDEFSNDKALNEIFSIISHRG